MLTLTPGALVYHDARRSRYIVGYSRPYTFYFGESERPLTDGDLAFASGIFLLSPRDELSVDVTASRTRSSLDLLRQTTETDRVLPTGDNELFTASARETFRRELSENLLGWESATFALTNPLETELPQPPRYTLAGELGAEYVWRRDAYRLTVDATYLDVFDEEAAATVIPAQRQLIANVIGTWRRDLSESFTSALHGGASLAVDLERDDSFAAPLWGASLTWSRFELGVTLLYQRRVTANLDTGSVLQTDLVQLSGALPIWTEAGLTFTTAHGMSWNREVNDDRDRVNNWRSEAALRWNYRVFLPSVEARYTHVRQFNAPANDPLFFDYSQNAFSLTVSGMFPPRRIDRVPTTPPLRVDAADRDPTAPGIDAAPSPSPASPSGGSPVR